MQGWIKAYLLYVDHNIAVDLRVFLGIIPTVCEVYERHGGCDGGGGDGGGGGREVEKAGATWIRWAAGSKGGPGIRGDVVVKWRDGRLEVAVQSREDWR